MTIPSFEEHVPGLLASEVARWRTLSFDEIAPMVGLSGRTTLDESAELSMAVSVQWDDANEQAVRVRISVEAQLPLSRCRIVQAVVVARPAFAILHSE